MCFCLRHYCEGKVGSVYGGKSVLFCNRSVKRMIRVYGGRYPGMSVSGVKRHLEGRDPLRSFVAQAVQCLLGFASILLFGTLG